MHLRAHPKSRAPQPIAGLSQWADSQPGVYLRFLFIACVALLCVFARPAWGQDGPASEKDSPDFQQSDPASPQIPAVSEDDQRNASSRLLPKTSIKKLSESEIAEVRIMVSNLAAGTFADRERAAEDLLMSGLSAVPTMRRELKMTSDPEVTLRLRALIHQLHDGEFESKVKAFTEGQEVDFEGWDAFKIKFGNSLKARDLFISLVREYPEVLESLNGTPRESALAMELVRSKVTLKMYKAGPTLADAVALLLPAADQNVPITAAYEGKLLFILRLSPVSTAPRDPVLGPAFKKLVSSWVQRSTPASRRAVFTFALQREIYSAYPLALSTIAETESSTMIAMSMQVLSRFGSKEDTHLFLKFLQDDRTLDGLAFQYGARVKVQLCDAAIAGIAVLHEIPLSKLGLPDAAADKRYGFHYEDLVYQIKRQAAPNNQDFQEQRKAVVQKREMAKKLILKMLPAKYTQGYAENTKPE